MLYDSIKLNNLRYDLVPMLRKYITPEKYGILANTLIEIMLRRQKEFNISDERLEREAENLVNHLQEIRVASQRELHNENAFALSRPGEILISKEYLDSQIKESGIESLENLFETLTHEVYHSVAMSELGTAFYTASQNLGLNEALNEAAANRASTNFTPKEYKQGFRDTKGYGTITFLPQFLSKAIGSTEEELLSAGISKGAFYKVHELARRNVGLEDEEFTNKTVDWLATISGQIKVLHNVDYGNGGIGSSNKNIREQVLKGIFLQAFDYMSLQIENDKREITPELTGEYAGRFYDMIKIMNNVVKNYESNKGLSKNQANSIYQAVFLDNLQTIENLENQILGINFIANSEEWWKKYDKEAKSGKFFKDPEKIDGILSGEKNRIFKYKKDLSNIYYQYIYYNIDSSKYENYVREKDFNEDRVWDNSASFDELGKWFEENKKKKIKLKRNVKFLRFSKAKTKDKQSHHEQAIGKDFEEER